MAGPTSSSRQYNYKKPSSFNFVSFLMLLALAAGAYWVWKFGPIYYTRYKVEEVLQEGSSEASGIRRMNEAAQMQIEQDVLQRTVDRLAARGVTAERYGLQVYFDDNYRTLHAAYAVIVRHPAGKPTTVRIHRKVSVPE